MRRPFSVLLLVVLLIAVCQGPARAMPVKAMVELK